MIRILLIYVFLFTTFLIARTNPFEPSDGSNLVNKDTNQNQVSNDGSKRIDLTKIISVNNDKRNTNATKNHLSKKVAKKKTKTLITKKAYNKKEVSKQSMTSQMHRTNPNNLAVSNNSKYVAENQQVSPVEQREIIPMVPNATRYNILPLLTIDLMDKTLTILTSNNYKLIKYYEDHQNKKFVFDFKAKLSVPSARENFTSQYFKSYTVGNHPEDGFIRVVIPSRDDMINYKVEIKNNTAIVTHN